MTYEIAYLLDPLLHLDGVVNSAGGDLPSFRIDESSPICSSNAIGRDNIWLRYGSRIQHG